jgi:transketolase
MLHALVQHPGPAYIRVNRNDLPVYTPPDRPYAIGDTQTVREGHDVVVFANGVMVSKAVTAAETLSAEDIGTKVVNVSTVKPLNVDAILSAVGSVRRGIVVAEEHTVMGGLAGAILEALHGQTRLPVEVIGIRDSFGTSARSYEELLAYFGLTDTAIASAARGIAAA